MTAYPLKSLSMYHQLHPGEFIEGHPPCENTNSLEGVNSCEPVAVAATAKQHLLVHCV